LNRLYESIKLDQDLKKEKDAPLKALISDDPYSVTPEHMAYRRMIIHQQKMQVYKERFEEDNDVNHRELWKYITNKVANGGENVLKASANPKHTRHMVESEEIAQIQMELEDLIEDPATPSDEREQAEVFLKTLKLQPLQAKMRDQVL